MGVTSLVTLRINESSKFLLGPCSRLPKKARARCGLLVTSKKGPMLVYCIELWEICTSIHLLVNILTVSHRKSIFIFTKTILAFKSIPGVGVQKLVPIVIIIK